MSVLMPPSTHSLDDWRKLHAIYASMPRTPLVSDTITTTYGEILYPDIERLIRLLPLTHQDVFLDLGSGLGKAAIQFFLHSPVNTVYGVEINSAWHQTALCATERCREIFDTRFTPDRQLRFIHGDFLQVPLPKPSIVLIASPCFTSSMDDALCHFIESSTTIRWVYALRPLFWLQRLTLHRIVRVQCSWDAAWCYIYALAAD